MPSLAAAAARRCTGLVSALVLACVLLAGCAPELDWRELSMPEGRFAVLLPGKPRRESRQFNDGFGMVTMTMHACSLAQGTMGVSYTDYPAGATALTLRRDAARDALLRNISGNLLQEEAVGVDGHPGRQIHAEGRRGTDRIVLRARFVLVGDRLYQVAYVGVKDSLPAEDIDMFLNSFRLRQ